MLPTRVLTISVLHDHYSQPVNLQFIGKPGSRTIMFASIGRLANQSTPDSWLKSDLRLQSVLRAAHVGTHGRRPVWSSVGRSVQWFTGGFKQIGAHATGPLPMVVVNHCEEVVGRCTNTQAAHSNQPNPAQTKQNNKKAKCS